MRSTACFAAVDGCLKARGWASSAPGRRIPTDWRSRVDWPNPQQRAGWPWCPGAPSASTWRLIVAPWLREERPWWSWARVSITPALVPISRSSRPRLIAAPSCPASPARSRRRVGPFSGATRGSPRCPARWWSCKRVGAAAPCRRRRTRCA